MMQPTLCVIDVDFLAKYDEVRTTHPDLKLQKVESVKKTYTHMILEREVENRKYTDDDVKNTIFLFFNRDYNPINRPCNVRSQRKTLGGNKRNKLVHKMATSIYTRDIIRNSITTASSPCDAVIEYYRTEDELKNAEHLIGRDAEIMPRWLNVYFIFRREGIMVFAIGMNSEDIAISPFLIDSEIRVGRYIILNDSYACCPLNDILDACVKKATGQT
jgi:hypothetical protein